MIQTLDSAIETLKRGPCWPNDPFFIPIVHNGKIAFVTIGQDSDAEDPAEGKMYSFSRNHLNYIEHDAFVALTEENQDFVLLSYYEHGRSIWMVASGPTPPGVEFHWDGVMFAGVWFPTKEILDAADHLEIGSKERHEAMARYAATDCEEYTQYCNGDVYYYNIDVYPVRLDSKGEAWDLQTDYRREEPENGGDSCGGFLGIDSLTEALIEALPTTL